MGMPGSSVPAQQAEAPLCKEAVFTLKISQAFETDVRGAKGESQLFEATDGPSSKLLQAFEANAHGAAERATFREPP
eukprot:4035035-Pyramimonas_sp.AAC.1